MNDHAWHYVRAGMQHGPVDLDTLVSVLRAEPDPRRVKVWREGLADWMEAGQLTELGSRLPPAVPVSSPPAVPRSAPAASGGFSPHPPTSRIVEQVEQVATLYRQLVGLVGLQLLLGCAANALMGFGEASAPGAGTLLAFGMLLVLLALAVYMTITAYRLAEALGESAPVLWAVAMFIPCVSLIALLVLSSKANDWCIRHGLRVGLLGPTRESIEELRGRG